MNLSAVEINDVRASVDAVLDTLQDSLRKVNYEVNCTPSCYSD